MTYSQIKNITFFFLISYYLFINLTHLWKDYDLMIPQLYGKSEITYWAKMKTLLVVIFNIQVNKGQVELSSLK